MQCLVHAQTREASVDVKKMAGEQVKYANGHVEGNGQEPLAQGKLN